MMKRKRSEKTAIMIGRIFVVILCLVCVANVLMPDQKTSATEQRTLQTFPKFNVEDALSGEYNNQIDDWFSDQFMGRNFLIHLKYLVQKSLGVKKIDDVYLAKDSLIQDTAKMNQENVKKNIDAINAYFQRNQVNTMFLLAPNAVSMNADQLPSHAFIESQNAQMDEIFKALSPSIAKIDVRDTLKKHRDEYLYYKTDHHWTSLASYYAMSEIAAYMEFDLPKISQYTKYPVTHDFKGTLAKKAGSILYADDIDIYVPKKNPDYVVTYEADQKKSRTIYRSDSLDTADPYTVFLGGNQSLIQIDIDNESDHHLLLFKDSYANSLIPFLIPYFRTITVVDPRYYTENIDRVMTSQLITDVMYVYNSNTFVQDQSLMDVLNEEKAE